MAVAKVFKLKTSFGELRIPQADKPVVWEAIVLLFVVRSTLSWGPANVVLLLGVMLMRWGSLCAGCCFWTRRRKDNDKDKKQ
mmetsp:Transcript_31238/g.81901  ORF Transcript_31238/g.81901 Transcript_31238/m.81901 type:complete len:82 (-) Transcript_31238:23-268(-)